MKPTQSLSACLLGASVALGALTAGAFPIAPVGTEGLPVLVSGGLPVIATYEGSSAGYNNLLYLELDGSGQPGLDGVSSNDLFIFANGVSPIGSQLNLGSFPIGTELVFRLFVNDTGYDYFTGAASRNPDALLHARVQDQYLPNTTLVSFEDLFGTPEFPDGYNDLSFSLENTSTQAVPETSTVLSGVGLAALAGLAAWKRRRA